MDRKAIQGLEATGPNKGRPAKTPASSDKAKPENGKSSTPKKEEVYPLEPETTDADGKTSDKGGAQALADKTAGKPISLEGVGFNPKLPGISVDLEHIKTMLTNVNEIVELSKAANFALMQDQMMSPEDLRAMLESPELKDYAPEVYEIEKRKFDSSQAMGRNMALSLISQVFSSASQTKGATATTGADVFSAGARSIQARADAVEQMNFTADKLNQELIDKNNTNVLNFVKDYNVQATSMVKQRNRIFYDTYKKNVEEIRAILVSQNLLAGQKIEAQKEASQEITTANTAKMTAENNRAMALLDNETRIKVANLDNQAKVAIANQVNETAKFMGVLKARQLDQDRETNNIAQNKDAYSTAYTYMSGIGVSPITLLKGMNKMSPEALQRFENSYGNMNQNFISTLKEMMGSDWFASPDVAGAGTVGQAWDEEGRAFIDLGQRIVYAGAMVTKDGWKELATLTPEEMDQVDIDPATGSLYATGDLKKKLDIMTKSGQLRKNVYSRDELDTMSAAWAISTGSALPSMMRVTGTEGMGIITGNSQE